MGRVVAIDYGTKRVGIAVTDPLRLIATPLATVETGAVMGFLKSYVDQEEVDIIVVGMPRRLNNTASAMTKVVKAFMLRLQKTFPDKSILEHDERYTSKIAQSGMIEAGFKQKDRRNKGYLDQMSAAILLQSFLNQFNNAGV